MTLYKQPKTKRGDETLRRIAKAAEKLFAEVGYYETQISDIAKNAGVAAGTFYIYFPTKLSVFQYILEDLGHELRKEIKVAIVSIKDPIEAEKTAVKTFFKFVTKHVGLFKIVWQAQFVDPESFKKYYERFSEGYREPIIQAQSKGIFRNYNPENLSFFLMGIYNFVALKYFVFDNVEPDEAVIEEIIAFVENGLRNREGK